jgi:alpha-tubulin suppressor-like RCC1 family protein
MSLVAVALFWPGAGARAAGLQIQALALGNDHACAITSEGPACWGNNFFGQVGDGTLETELTAFGTVRSTPSRVVGLDEPVTAIVAGGHHSCALTLATAVKCWGSSFFGELGKGTTLTMRPFAAGVCSDAACEGPLTGAVALGAGYGHTCAAMAGGGVKCWGWNGQGQVGDGTVTGLSGRATPVDVVGLDEQVTVLAGGYDHTCALTALGSVRCWGSNDSGQLGTETSETCPDPYIPTMLKPCSTTPLDVPGLESGVAAITAGASHTCALTDAGGVKCWGGNGQGQLGDGTTVPRSTPVDVVGLSSGVAAVSAGPFSFHTCAVTTSGGAKCWGDNYGGTLGDGTETDRSSPVNVCARYDDGTEQCLETLSRAEGIFVGYSFSCGLLRGGSLSCWGSNSTGQFAKGMSDLGTATAASLDLGNGDADVDGCGDKDEAGALAREGGRRDPLRFWDFFDTPNDANERDGAVTAGDLSRIVMRFGATGSRYIPPRLPPEPVPAYHSAFDRTLVGPEPWDAGMPNGSITARDIALSVAQFGHNCV